MKARVRVIVSGLVQGVFFRSCVRERATEAGVTGFVGNRPDGKVEAVFEGEGRKVMELVDFCRQGPPRARVEKIDVRREEHKGEFATFSVRR